MSEHPEIKVEMLPDGHPLLRFGFAVCTRKDAADMRTSLAGELTVALQSLEEAKTLRDGLSALIAFHEGVQPKESGTMSDEIRRPR